MYYNSHTSKETIIERLKSVFNLLKDNQYKVIILNDDECDIVLFQVILIDKHLYLNDLLCLGLAPHNPTINTNEDNILITWHVKKL